MNHIKEWEGKAIINIEFKVVVIMIASIIDAFYVDENTRVI